MKLKNPERTDAEIGQFSVRSKFSMTQIRNVIFRKNDEIKRTQRDF